MNTISLPIFLVVLTSTAFAQKADGVRRGRARAEPDHHAVLDVGDRLRRGLGRLHLDWRSLALHRETHHHVAAARARKADRAEARVVLDADGQQSGQDVADRDRRLERRRPARVDADGLHAEPDDAAYVLAHTEGVVGFFGASSMERLPTETAMTENMRRFKAIPV